MSSLFRSASEFLDLGAWKYASQNLFRAAWGRGSLASRIGATRRVGRRLGGWALGYNASADFLRGRVGWGHPSYLRGATRVVTAGAAGYGTYKSLNWAYKKHPWATAGVGQVMELSGLGFMAAGRARWMSGIGRGLYGASFLADYPAARRTVEWMGRRHPYLSMGLLAGGGAGLYRMGILKRGGMKIARSYWNMGQDVGRSFFEGLRTGYRR
jgi:hypothetical protein